MRTFSVLVTAVALLATAAVDAAAQQRRIAGQVTAEGSGEPLAGASVSVVGTTVGAYTGEDGRFALTVPEGSTTLLVRRIGYQRQNVDIPPGAEEVNVALVRDVLQLEAQVVTGSQTSVARINAANDVATVTAEQLTRAPAPTIEHAIQGKVPGATIQANSGAPGGGMQVQLRGVSTINAAGDPLYVVDGIIVSNDAIASGANAITNAAGGGNASNQDNPVNRIADLNPNDIESMEILKGASASAIYGSKAANGVIIITTKRGTASGRPQFTIRQSVGTFDLANKIGSRRFYSVDEALDAFASNTGATAADTARVVAAYGTGRMYDHEEQLYGRNDLSYETNVSVRGGNEQTRYYVSGLVKRDEGIMENTGYTKQSLRVNLSQSLGSKLTLDANTLLLHSLAQRSLSNNDNSGTSYYMVLPFTPSFVDLQPQGGVYPSNPFERSNPVQTSNLIRNDEDVYRLTGSARIRYDLLSSEQHSVVLTANGGVDQFTQLNGILSPPELQFEPQDGLPGTIVRGNADVLNANIDVTGVHTWHPASGWGSATTSAGFQRGRRSQQITSVVAQDLIPGQGNIDQAATHSINEERELVKDFALFAQEEILTLDERLLVTVGARAERSTNNGDVDKFYFFPKGSISYRLPSFAPQIDEFKLRAAVGQAGNQPLYGMKFSSLITGVYDGRTGYRTALVAGDPDIEPEITTEVEGGFDAQLFRGRGSVTLTVYQRTINDLILQRTAAPSTGFQTELFNGGELRNRGIEIAVAATPYETADLAWISRATFARNTSRVMDLPVPAFRTGGFGASLGAFQFEEGKSATQIVGNTTDTLPDGTTQTRVVQLGDAAPDFQMAFSNELTWRRFSLFGLVDWKQGGDVINLTEFLYDAGQTSPDYVRRDANGDIVPGPGVQRISTWAAGFTRPYIQDGSYVKVREITVSYDLPAGLTSQVFRGTARSARIELSGRNLWTFTDYRGADPEVSNFGNQQIARNIDVAPFPPSRSFFLTLDVGF